MITVRVNHFQINLRIDIECAQNLVTVLGEIPVQRKTDNGMPNYHFGYQSTFPKVWDMIVSMSQHFSDGKDTQHKDFHLAVEKRNRTRWIWV